MASSNDDNNDKSNTITTAQVLLSDPALGTTAKASSVLQKNIKLYGPHHVLDYHNKLTCWNSEGTPAITSSSSRSGGCSHGGGSNTNKKKNDNNNHDWICIDFGRPIQPQQIQVQFQAGFVAESMQVWITSSSHNNNNNNNNNNNSSSESSDRSASVSWIHLCEEEVEDDHQMQNFVLDQTTTTTITAMKLVFLNCTDFYGRIIIYQVQVYGQEAS